MIAEIIKAINSGLSWIRQVFDTGAGRETQHGPESAYDFSPGYPSPDPPLEYRQAQKATDNETGPMGHVPLPHTGCSHGRKAAGNFLAGDLQKDIRASDIVVTCGGAGAVETILKTLQNPGDEAITPAFYFVEKYRSISDCPALNTSAQARPTAV